MLLELFSLVLASDSTVKASIWKGSSFVEPRSCNAEPKHSTHLCTSCRINHTMFQKIHSFKSGGRKPAGGVSYLGSHDAEAHAVVLLQGYRDNLWILPHWLKERETENTI